MRTWAFVDGDAAFPTEDWTILGTETSRDARFVTYPRLWVTARLPARGTTFVPYPTSATLCQHIMTHQRLLNGIQRFEIGKHFGG